MDWVSFGKVLLNCEKIQGERTWEKIEKYRDVGFYFSIVGFSVFLNIESMSVSAF